jgi:hypothetical protein
VVSAHVKCDVPEQAERAGTALGLLITQRSHAPRIGHYAASIVDQLENPTTRRKQISFAC